MVFGLFSKRSQTTFKQRVQDFWKWYPTVADRFFKTIEDGRCADLGDEVGQFVDRTLPGLHWVFGPGVDGGHSFTLTGEGAKPLQLLTQYWLSQAPRIRHWTFHASRQASPPESLKEIAIRLNEESEADAENMLLKTRLDEEEQVIHVVAWHPAFEDLPDEAREQIVFLLLDEALGEFGTEQWIGSIDVAPVNPGPKIIKLTQLQKFIDDLVANKQWEKPGPLDSYACYRIEEQSRHRRGDTIAGTTRLPEVVFSLLENRGRLKPDPLKDTGAELVYISLDLATANFPSGEEADARGALEDQLQEALESQASGTVLGGAHGTGHAYIDILLFDGEDGRRIIKETLAGAGLRGGWTVETFV